MDADHEREPRPNAPDPGAEHDLPGSVEGPDIESVPAGGAGADSGAAETVEVEEGDEAPVPDVSPQNDIPGVGTRRPRAQERDPDG